MRPEVDVVRDFMLENEVSAVELFEASHAPTFVVSHGLYHEEGVAVVLVTPCPLTAWWCVVDETRPAEGMWSDFLRIDAWVDGELFATSFLVFQDGLARGGAGYFWVDKINSNPSYQVEWEPRHRTTDE